MKEKLIIRNFGPIKEVDLDLGKVTVLIGEQATGKSTVAKVLAMCRYFSFIVGDRERRDLPFEEPFKDGLIAWGLKECIKKNSYFFYQSMHYVLEVEFKEVTEYEDVDIGVYENKYVDYECSLTPLSQEFKNLLSELEKINPKQENDISPILSQARRASGFGWTIPTSFFLNDVKKVMDNPIYSPTQRGLQSIFSIGKESIRNLSDSLFNQLAKMDGISRLFKQETYIEPLDIYYVNRDGHGFIRKANEEQYYSLYNAASGYQSMIPIVLVVKYYTELKKKTKTLIIEEPELDVFPSAQNKLIQYLCEKAKVHDSMLLFTTHSPYTLTSLNNLMYAYQVGQENPEKVSKEIDKKYWLNPEDISAYMMKSDGTVEDIFDREEGMIQAEKIDSASTEINMLFDKLLNIEFTENELNT